MRAKVTHRRSDIHPTGDKSANGITTRVSYPDGLACLWHRKRPFTS